MKKYLKIILIATISILLYYLLRFTWFEVYDDYGNYAFKDFIGPGHFVIYAVVVFAMCISCLTLCVYVFYFLSKVSISEKHPILSTIFSLFAFSVCLVVLGVTSVNFSWELYIPICLVLSGPSAYFIIRLTQAAITFITCLIRRLLGL